MPFPLLIPLIMLAVGTAAAVIIHWDQISNWFTSNKVRQSDYGELIKEYERDGKVRYVSGVFTKEGQCRSAVYWEGTDDSEIRHWFHNTDRVHIDI